MSHITSFFARLGSSVQRIWRSERFRAIAGRMTALAALLALSPQIVSLWRIALYGAPLDQGVLFAGIAAVVVIYRTVRKVRSIPKGAMHEKRKRQSEPKRSERKPERQPAQRGSESGSSRRKPKARRS